jgi:hypothetical protein
VTTEPAATPLDSEALTHVEPLVDTWLSGKGKRLYRLAERVGDYPPVFALSTYERAVDPESGDTVETETLEDAGTLVPFVNMGTDKRRATQRLIDDNPEFWDEGTVERMHKTFEQYLKDRLHNLVETAPTGKFVDIHLLEDVRIAFDEDLEAYKLAERDRSFGETEWAAYLWAVKEETTLIADLYSEDVPAEQAYSFRPTFEAAPDWRFHAVELIHCGVLKNAPALANLTALKQYKTATSQADLAAELGKSPSTISQQVEDLQEWSERAAWTCDSNFVK